MSYKMTKEEKETNILWNQTQEPVLISGYDPALLRKCAAFAEKHPDLCRRVDKHKYPDYAEYEIQKDRVSIRLLEPYSEERKKAAAEKVKRLHQDTSNEQF